MKKLLFIIAISLRAQSIDADFTPQDCVLDSLGNPKTAPCSIHYNDATMPYPDLRYSYGGGVLSYNISYPNGPIFLTLQFSEPNKIASNQRVFSLRVNNQPPITIDVFKLSNGLKRKLEITVPLQITDQIINLTLTPSIGNAILNGISIQQIPSFVTRFFSCISLPSCTGINYLVAKNGTFFAISTPQDFVFDPKSWKEQ